MNLAKTLLSTAIATAALVAGAAQARGVDEIRWSVTVSNQSPVPVHVTPRVVVGPVPVWTRPYPGYGDRDRDGIPNRYDRRPDHRGKWHSDVDRDGIPDRYDRSYNPPWDVDGDGIPNRYDRLYNPRWDRDGDGIPNRHDPYPDYPRRGGR